MSHPTVSAWLTTHLEAIREAHRLGPVVDLACGRGRHALALARAGIPTIGIDRNRNHLRELEVLAGREQLQVQTALADLETEYALPIRPASCGALLVFRFLYRPLAPAICETLAPGGLLLYETFHVDHRATGRGPRSPEFYLEPGELRGLFPSLEVLAYEEGPSTHDASEITARLIARR